MRVFVAGATGAVGRRLVVELGVAPVGADALDGVAVARAVAEAARDVVAHQLTGLADGRGASNARAKEELGWRPAHLSWRAELAEATA